MPFIQEQKKKKEEEAATKGAEAAGRFVKAKPDSLKKLQEFGQAEAERAKKEAEEKKKKKNAPPPEEKGFLRRMYESVMGEK